LESEKFLCPSGYAKVRNGHILLPLPKIGSTTLKKGFTTPDKKLSMRHQKKSFVLLLFIKRCLNTLKIGVGNTLELVSKHSVKVSEHFNFSVIPHQKKVLTFQNLEIIRKLKIILNFWVIGWVFGISETFIIY
jgi:hypothetical protein